MRRVPVSLLAGIAVVMSAACSGDEGAATKPAAVGGLNADVIVRLEPKPVADFVLNDQDGNAYRLSEHQDKVRLFYFGYTGCPDICPTTMVDYRDTKRLLGGAAVDVTFIMVTVDPESDSPPVLKQFLSNFDPAFVGLSGSPADLQSVWDSFGVRVRKLNLPESATGHSISHSASVYAVDRSGDLAMKFTFDADPEDMARGVRELLEQS